MICWSAQVATTVGEVREIFTELATLVSEQGTHIDQISSAIENTAHQASRAAGELQVASRYASRNRSRLCCCYLSGVVMAVVLLLLLMFQLRAA